MGKAHPSRRGDEILNTSLVSTSPVRGGRREGERVGKRGSCTLSPACIRVRVARRGVCGGERNARNAL